MFLYNAKYKAYSKNTKLKHNIDILEGPLHSDTIFSSFSSNQSDKVEKTDKNRKLKELKNHVMKRKKFGLR